MAPHGATSSGKYYNGCTTADVNKGSYGKLSSSQIEERIELHARRKIEGKPTVAEIANHWMDKHGIEMSYQSEKQWCRTPDNKALIDAKQEELEQAGELIRPELSTQTLVNSLAATAQDNAENCRNLKRRLNSAMNDEYTPWAILGISEDEYFEAIGPERMVYDSKAQIIIQAKKDALDLAIKYSRAHISMSKEFRESVKQTYEMGKYLGIVDAQVNRKKRNASLKAEIEDVKQGETMMGEELVEIDVEKARKSLGYEDN